MADIEYSTPPECLTKVFIENVLKTERNEPNLTIIDFNIVGATSKGDNFSSIMSRASYTIKTGSKQYSQKAIIKTMPTAKMAILYVENQKLFEKEKDMLVRVIPAAEELLLAAGEECPLAPKVYFSELLPNPIIMMEDLCELGFQVGDRHLGLTLDQTLSVVKALATFHVATKVLLKRDKELHQICQGSFWGYNNRGSSETMFRSGFKQLLENVDHWSGDNWSDKLRPLQNRIPDDIYALYDAKKDGETIVINHGDMWTNNMMFRPGPNGKYQVRFVDLQLSSVRSPVFDLHYFIFTSPANKIRIKELDTILGTYHERWSQVCQLLNEPDDYSLEDLKNDFKDKLLFGFAILYGLFPVISAKKEDAPDANEKKEEMDSNLFLNKNYQQGVLMALPYFEAQGLFE